MNPKAIGKLVRRAALLVLCLGIVLALLVFSNRERQPWSHVRMIGVNGQRITSIYAGQSGNQEFARLLRALPALAKARMANWKLMTSFQVHAASPSCAAVKAAVMKVSQTTPSSQVKPNNLVCLMCYAKATTYQCFTACTDDDYYDEYYAVTSDDWRSFMSKPIVFLCAVVLALGLGQVRSSAQESSTATLTRSEAHVIFDGTAFVSGPAPHWANGYLVSLTVETFAPDSPNVRLYDKTGAMARSATAWFPGSTRVALTSATVGPQGEIIASGEADRADGARARFIASVSAGGKITAIQTGDFDADQVCAAPDGTIWSLGDTGWDSTVHHPKPGETFRHFDMQRGQIGAYVPRSTFPDRPAPYELSYLSCGENEVAAYSPTGVFIEASYGGSAARVYKATIPTGYRLYGLAVEGPRQVFGLLQKRLNFNVDKSGVNGLYSLAFDETSSAALWVPVPGAAGSYNVPGMPTRLYGIDGDYIVLGHSKDSVPGSLHWDSLTARE